MRAGCQSNKEGFGSHMIRRFVWIFLVFVFLSQISQGLYAREDIKPAVSVPAIYAAEPVYDFGKIPSGQIVNHEFGIENRGQTDLQILRVSTSCGCTVAQSMPQQIKPGETGRISVRFDSRGRVGKQDKAVTVYSNDPSNPQLICHLKGELI